MVMGEEFEWFGIFWRRYLWWRRYFEEDIFGGRMENFVEFGGRKRKERKGKKEKKLKKEDILLEEKVKIIRVADSRDLVADAENFRKNTEIVRKSNISERPAKILKNQEYYSKNHGEIHFKKFFLVFKLKILESAANIGRHQIWQKSDKL